MKNTNYKVQVAGKIISSHNSGPAANKAAQKAIGIGNEIECGFVTAAVEGYSVKWGYRNEDKTAYVLVRE